MPGVSVRDVSVRVCGVEVECEGCECYQHVSVVYEGCDCI